MPLDRLHLATDARFWPAAASAFLEFAERHGASKQGLHSIAWIVPGGAHAVLARAALHAALSNRSFIAPRISPRTDWLGLPRSASTAERAELFSALRANRWVRDTFGAQAATLWALAGDVALLCDQLTWAALDAPDVFAERIQSSLARHFHRRAARAMQPQAQLVLQLWRARRAAADKVEYFIRELAARASAADAPLVYAIPAPGCTSSDAGLARWEWNFLQRYAERAPVLMIVPDVELSVRERPLLAAAWPELAGAGQDAAIATRADAIGAAGAPMAVPMSIVVSTTLEEEAIAVSRQVLAWRQEEVGSIALIALDRLTARRVRALLERAQVSVRDETGWKLSTTSAAAAVMRWYELAADDLYWRDLLDWLKSSFTLAGRACKAQEVFALERAIRASGALQGARAMRRALNSIGPNYDEHAAGARQLLDLIESQSLAAQRAGSTLADHARALQLALDGLGMRPALAADAVGCAVLRELDSLEAELAGVEGHATLTDFRALLAARFEDVAFVDRQIESPIVMVALASTSLRTFDAAVLIGADAQHLPAAPPELLFMSNAVRADLGLATVDAALRAQASQVASLLASVPRVLATWRTYRNDEPNALSPLLERLQFVTARALGDDLLREAGPESFEVQSRPQSRPAPSAAHLLPRRISASQTQSLVHCPYQFYARRLLGLAELDDIIELPDKRDFGELLHDILRRFHTEWGAFDFGPADPALLASSLAGHAAAVFGPRIERTPGLLAFQRRFEGLIGGYIEWLQQESAEGWRWTAGEQSERARFALRGGREVELVGRIDRIDTNLDGRVRLLDYKARAADVLKRGLIRPGEDIQLPFYGMLLARRDESASKPSGVDLVTNRPGTSDLSAHDLDANDLDANDRCTNPPSAAYVSFDRAREARSGVLSVAPPQPFERLVAEVGARLQRDLQRVADGAPLPAIGPEAVCKHCEMRGLCRRDDWINDEAHLASGGDR